MTTPENKRKAEELVAASGEDDADGQASSKKIRLNGADNGGEPAKPKPAVDMSVLEKAKKALEMQKALKEKLARLKQAQAAPPAAKPSSKLPPPLVLDEHGREVGAEAPEQPSRPKQLRLLTEPEPEDEAPGGHFDPSLGGGGRAQRRARPALQFVEHGTFQKQAETARLKAQLGDDYVRELAERRQREKDEEAAAGGIDANLVPLGVRPEVQLEKAEAEVADVVPDVEWWDARILTDKSTYGAAANGVLEGAVRADRITHYVEHPVLLDPPLQEAPPPPQPLRLTRRELKKLRTQRRQAREQEKQELIRQGLLEPPKPKVKISNLMRVLGAEAAADPTAIEAEVRRQMAERAAAHEDRNEARKLTNEERKEKKKQKLMDGPTVGADGAVIESGAHIAVYKVGSLATPQLRFKVQMNANENHMTGVALSVPNQFSLVVVEGGPKTLRRYEKLMLRRINWNPAQEDAGEEGAPPGPPNYCHLVWTGVAKEPAFKGRFKAMEVPTEGAARATLGERGVAHYWDLAAAFNPE